MQYDPLDRLAHHHANPDGLERLLHHRAPRFDSAQQFGAFVRIVWASAQDGPTGPAGVVSPTLVVCEMLELGGIVQTSPRHYTPSPVPYHEEWAGRVLDQAQLLAGRAQTRSDITDRLARQAGDTPMRAWVAMDVWGWSGRKLAKKLKTSHTAAYELADAGRLAVERALIAEGYLHQ